MVVVNLFAAAAALVVVLLVILNFQRRRDMVKAWAVSNHVTLVRRLSSWDRPSPFLPATLGRRRVQYWLVRDAAGMEHRVWLRLGDSLLGTLSDEVAEKWES